MKVQQCGYTTETAEVHPESGTGGWLEIENEDERSLKAIIQYGLKGISAYAEHAYQLKKHDREILRIIIERYNGGPVGAETLAISVGEAQESLEDFYEPYLIQQGFIMRTPRGRVATRLAWQHFGLDYPEDSEVHQEKLFDDV